MKTRTMTAGQWNEKRKTDQLWMAVYAGCFLIVAYLAFFTSIFNGR